MLYDSIFILIGLGLVAKGGDLFVDSSIYIGQALRVPRFVIGGTLVSLATTTPELVVSAMASGAGDSGIALGNAIGSCICNHRPDRGDRGAPDTRGGREAGLQPAVRLDGLRRPRRRGVGYHT